MALLDRAMKISFPVPTPEEATRAKRQFEYVQKAEEHRRERNQARAKALQSAGTAIARALAAYRKIEDIDVVDVRIRTPFIYTTDPRRTKPRFEPFALAAEVESRPLMTKLVARRSHALRLLFSAIYVAHMETKPGAAFSNGHPNNLAEHGRDSWLTLTGLQADVSVTNRRGLRRALNTALDKLVAFNLVSLGKDADTAGRYARFALLKEDGSRHQYTVPAVDAARTRNAIGLPVDFFRQGWHLVLTDLELVTLLAIIDLTGLTAKKPRSGDLAEQGVGLGQVQRNQRYGLSDEAYNSIHMLHRCGLIDVVDPMPERRNGRLPAGFYSTLAEGTKTESNSQIPYRVIYPSSRQTAALAQPALKTMLDVLD
jgi:hypothetical protein